LVEKLGIRRELSLMFDMGNIQSRLVELLRIYVKNLEKSLPSNEKQQDEDEEEYYTPDAEPYYEGIKVILNFFCNEACMDTFGENNID
jgi:hypothetical protein